MVEPDLSTAIDALLPQTQCTRCGFPDCRSYANAIANEGTPINQCPPGGQSTVDRLASLTGATAVAQNPVYGIQGPRTSALIDESRCIGCTLCIQACPVDAIVGAAKRMHTVLTAHCTGCDLCLPPCPVDCIDMVRLDTLATAGFDQAKRVLAHSMEEMASLSRKRYVAHQDRLSRQRKARDKRLRETGRRDPAAESARGKTSGDDRKVRTIAAAMARAQARRQGQS